MIIDSPANPVVKLLKALADSKSRRTRRQFVAEGVRAVEDGLRAGFVPDVCLYSPDMLKRTERGTTLLRALSKLPPLTLYEATERALSAASETLHPQGVVAAFPLPTWGPPDSASGAFMALVCDDMRDPGNMGTLLRSAEAAGVNAVWTTVGSVDIYNPKVVRAAMGTHFRLPIYQGQTWEQIINVLTNLGIEHKRLHCTSMTATLPYDAVDWTQPTTLVISNEAHGLSDEARDVCAEGTSITIPMAGDTESLNAAIAGAVIMFEAARQRRRGTDRA